MDWLHEITQSLASQFAMDPSALALSQETRSALLDVARVASHTSGDRTNAPLLCYVLGLLTQQGIPLGDAITAVTTPT